MGYSERIADETANHYDELRDRRVPRLLAWWMAIRFHRELTYSVIQDDQFRELVGQMLDPISEPRD
jgi:hypothetical protein